MSLRTVYIIVYLGLLGFLVFLAIRPVADLHTSVGIEVNRVAASQAAAEILRDFGMSQVDDYIPLVRRQQRSYLYTDLIDSLGRADNRNPSALNRAGIPLSGWMVMFLKPYEDITGILGDESLFQEYGLAAIAFDNQLRVRSFRARPDQGKAMFYGNALDEVLGDVLTASGFVAEMYTLVPDTLSYDVFENNAATVNAVQASHTAEFVRSGSLIRTPERITITYEPEIVQVTRDGVTDWSPAISVTRVFSSYTILDEDTPVSTSPDISQFLVLFVSMAGWTLLLLVVSGRLIFRGEVIWLRALIIASSVVLLLMIYRFLSMHYLYYQLFTAGVIGLDLLFYLASALSAGLFTGLGYLIWDAYARRQDHEQIPHIDGLWSWNIFQQKIGKAILAGYGYAGLSLGFFALGLFAFGSVYSISDDAFGFTSVSSMFPVLTNLINSLTYVPILTYAIIGVGISLIQVMVSRTFLVIIAASLLIGTFVGFGISFVTISGSNTVVLLTASLLAIPLALAYRFYGIITTAIAVWVIFMVVRLGPFLASADQVILTQGYVLAVITFLPFTVGLVLHHFGRDDLILQNFIPEYESKLKQQLRIEREFQIAKESQFAMMPKAAPDVGDVDIQGFFIPSFEVSGDFYDHVVIRDQYGHPSEIMLTVVDVSGKAMKAALTAIFTSGLLLSSSREEGLDPAVVLTGINPILYERTDNQSFITCLLARYELHTRRLHYVNAGHCMPILKRGGKAVFLRSDNPKLPLGIRPEVRYVTSDVDLQPGDILMLYSDGLPEARSRQGGLYEFDRVLQTLEMLKTESMTADAICDYFKQEILTFSDYELADDMTLVVLKI